MVPAVGAEVSRNDIRYGESSGERLRVLARRRAAVRWGWVHPPMELLYERRVHFSRWGGEAAAEGRSNAASPRTATKWTLLAVAGAKRWYT